MIISENEDVADMAVHLLVWRGFLRWGLPCTYWDMAGRAVSKRVRIFIMMHNHDGPFSFCEEKQNFVGLEFW